MPAGSSASTYRGAATAEAIATAERNRILAIQSLARPGCEHLIAACKADPKCTPEMAALRILKEQQTPGAVARRILAAHRTAQGR